MESSIATPYADKREIEPGHAVYTVDYSNYAETADNFYAHAKMDKASPLNRFIISHEIIGQGQDATFKLKLNLRNMLEKSNSLQVSGLDGSVKASSPADATELIKSLVKIENGQPMLDGQKLLAVIQAMGGDNFKSLSYDKKQEMLAQTTAVLQLVSQHVPGMVVVRNGDELAMRIPVDGMFAALEKLLPPESKGFISVHRESGKANIRVDYNQFVEHVFHKAQNLIAAKDPTGASRIEHLDADTVKLVLSKGGDGHIIDNALNKLPELIAESAKKNMPKGISMKMLSEEPSKGSSIV